MTQTRTGSLAIAGIRRNVTRPASSAKDNKEAENARKPRTRTTAVCFKKY